MKQYISLSAKETKTLGTKIAKEIKAGVIILTGELGAGKTTFVQGFAKGLGIKEKIMSPTFVLIRQHQIPSSDKIFYHIDLYRLEEEMELNNLGLLDLWSNPKNIIIIEWGEKIKDLPKGNIKISIQKENLHQRKFLIQNS